MRRVTSEEGDIFNPKGQPKKEIELARAQPSRVVEILSPYISNERLDFIDRVTAGRISSLTAAVEGVVDPHNTAAVIRTAEAFGMKTVHIIENETAFHSSRRVTRGTHKWIDLAVWKTPEAFVRAVRAQNKQILFADARADLSLYDIDPSVPAALVFGNERNGVSDKMRELCDRGFFIPMKGFAESLNVSVAAAVSVSSLCRQKKGDLSHAEKEVLKARYCLRAVRAGYDIAMLALGGVQPPVMKLKKPLTPR